MTASAGSGSLGQAGPRGTKLALAAYMVTSTVIGATLSFSYPLLSLVLERHGVSTGSIGLNAALSGLAVFLFAPWLPRLINRLGPVRSVLLGQALAATCLLGFPLEVDLVLWSALRFGLGAGVAIAWIACEAAVNALADERFRARIMGAYATLFCIGYALGPLLVSLTGSAGATPFLVAAAMVAASALPLIVARHTGPAMAGPGSSDLARIFRLAPFALVTILVFGIVETTLFALLPVYGIALGHGETVAALLLSVLIAGNVLFQVPIGWVADRSSRSATLLACAAIAMLGLLAWPAVMTALGPALPVLLIGGGALGGLYSLSLTLLGQTFRGGDLAAANTAFVATYQLGAMIGPPLAGLAMTAAGPEGLPFGLAAVLALFLVVACRLARPAA